MDVDHAHIGTIDEDLSEECARLQYENSCLQQTIEELHLQVQEEKDHSQLLSELRTDAQQPWGPMVASSHETMPARRKSVCHKKWNALPHR